MMVIMVIIMLLIRIIIIMTMIIKISIFMSTVIITNGHHSGPGVMLISDARSGRSDAH